MELSDYLKNDYKVYVDVNEDHLSDGRIIPLSFLWEDGRRYLVDEVKDICPAASLKAGGVGLRYTIRVGSRQSYMWLEEDQDVYRWFMERRELKSA